jgi:hypothetical protein
MVAPRVTVEIKGLDRQLAALAQTDKKVMRELRAGLGRGLKMVKSEVVPKVPVWSGRTVKGFRSTIKTAKGQNFLTGRFYNKGAFYLRMVQEGRGPGKAPWQLPGRFVAWVADKTGESGAALTSTVFRLLHSIQMSGTKQAQGDLMGEALKAAEPGIVAQFRAAVDKILRELEVKS